MFADAKAVARQGGFEMKKITTIGILVFAVTMLFGCQGMKSDFNSATLVRSITANPATVAPQETSIITCDVTGYIISIAWSATGGTISGSGESVMWKAPTTAGDYKITCTASDSDDSDSKSVNVTVVLPKWTLPIGVGIQSSDINKATGEIYAVTRGNQFPFTIDNNLSIVKFDNNGTIAWTKTVQVPGYEIAFVDFIKLSPDGNIIYLFWRKPTDCGICTSGGIAVSSFDSLGNHLWTKDFDSTAGFPVDLVVDNTGAYAIACVSWVNAAVITKFSPSGDIVWQKTNNADLKVSNVVNGELYVTGRVYNDNTIMNVYIAKYSMTGVCVLEKNLGGAELDEGDGIVVIPDGDFAGIYVSGISKMSNYDFSGRRFLVQKYDLDGNLKWTKDNYFAIDSAAWHIIADSTGLYVSGTELFKLNFDGTVVWKYPVNLNYVGSDMFVRDNVLFTTSREDNYLSRYDTITGTKL